MGSYASCYLGDFYIGSSKNDVDPGLLSLFIEYYNPKNRHKRKTTWDAQKNPEGRWRKFTYEELMARDKTSLDLFWLKDKSLTDIDNLPEPDLLAQEIIENLESGINSFREVLAGLRKTR